MWPIFHTLLDFMTSTNQIIVQIRVGIPIDLVHLHGRLKLLLRLLNACDRAVVHFCWDTPLRILYNLTDPFLSPYEKGQRRTRHQSKTTPLKPTPVEHILTIFTNLIRKRIHLRLRVLERLRGFLRIVVLRHKETTHFLRHRRQSPTSGEHGHILMLI